MRLAIDMNKILCHPFNSERSTPNSGFGRIQKAVFSMMFVG